MENSFSKAIATIAIWVLSVGLGISSIFAGDGNYNGDSIMMVIFPLVFAMLTTAFIWIGKAMLPWVPPDVIRAETHTPRTSDDYEKAKRGASRGDSKFDMLMSMMDEDEREAFKETLKRQVLNNMRLSDEGELPEGLESLLDEPSSSQRRRY